MSNSVTRGIVCHFELLLTKALSLFRMEFNETKLSKIYLRRTKEETLKNDLPQKNERIVFCRLTAIQKAMYQHILEQPDFEHLKSTSKSCDCGVNSAIYRKALQLRTDNERLAFLRRHKSEIKKMGECCYEAPFADGRGSVENGDEIHPDAVLWKRHHPTGKLCERCPYCCLFPALVVLSKVCSHACLIQVDPHNRTGKSDAEMEHAKAMAEVSEKIWKFLAHACRNSLVYQLTFFLITGFHSRRNQESNAWRRNLPKCNIRVRRFCAFWEDVNAPSTPLQDQ